MKTLFKKKNKTKTTKFKKGKSKEITVTNRTQLFWI